MEYFRLFSPSHLSAMAAVVFVCLSIILLRNKLASPPINKAFRVTAAVLLLLQAASRNIYEAVAGMWTLQYSLPFHICDASVYLCVILLISKSYGIFEVVYFWGLGGAVQAVLTPDLGEFVFPHFIYFQFFIAHGLVIAACIFMIFVEGYKPGFRSAIKTICITNLYAAFVTAVNLVTGGNYLYLMRKPAGASIIDFLGPWPWYVLSLEGVLILIVFVYYLPFGAVLFLSGRGSGGAGRPLAG